MKNTPEPWKERQEIKRHTGRVIGIENEHGITIMHGTYFPPHIGRARANYKRARIAVNACAGIPTEALEADVIRRMRDYIKATLTDTGTWLPDDAKAVARILLAETDDA